MTKHIIHTIVDTHLNKMLRCKINALPKDIAPEMQSEQPCEDEGWAFWLPIASKVNENEIVQWEQRIGYKLPESYKIFLQYKHFYELLIAEASFLEHAVDTWQASYSDVLFAEYSQPFLLDKGYIPFADWSDWGYLCFDANRNTDGHNYPIVLWDHETADEVEDFAADFVSLLVKLDEQDKQTWIG